MEDIWDPIKFAKRFWPHIDFYNKQREIIYSVVNDDETVVPAGNMLGKDFVAGFIVLWFFMSRHPCRVVTTSVDGTQLEAVLWGEIRRFLEDSVERLPILNNHCFLRKYVDGKIDPISYVVGRVSSQEGEGMAGHHCTPKVPDRVPRTLFVADEASGVYDKAFEKAEKWANRKLIIGNPNPCSNYFFTSVERGNVRAPANGRYYTKVIKIAALDSPNIRYALAQKAKGLPITDEEITPGVQSYSNYLKALETWNVIQQSVGLLGEFYKGAEVMLYPAEYREHSKKLARGLVDVKRHARAIGVDTAEGGDDTCWAVVDEKGLIDLIAMKTPDTSVIPGKTISMMREHNVKPENVVFDNGGGGKEHADNLRSKGFDVRGVAFGGSIKDINRFKKMKTKKDRVGSEDEKDVYKNRRAEMYGILRNLMNPKNGGFAIPEEYTELYRQLSKFPLKYDDEGKMWLPPKRNVDPNSKKETIIDLLGCSPDETDSLVLATYGMTVKATKKFAGAI